MKGETTASRKSAGPVMELRGAAAGDLGVLCEFGQAKQYSEKQPEIRIQNEVLISLQALKGKRKQEEKGVPENHKGKREPGGTFQLAHYLPRGNQDRGAHGEPKSQADNSEFQNDVAEAALDRVGRRDHVENPRDVLAAQGNGANAKAVGPTRRTKGRNEVGERVVSGAMHQFIRGTSGVQSLGINGEAVEQGVGNGEKEKEHGEAYAQQRALQSAKNAPGFALPPRGAPDKSGAADQRAADAPHEHTARRAHHATRRGQSEGNEREDAAAPHPQ